MKKFPLSGLAVIGLCLTSPAADLLWSPTSAVWDTTTSNWLNLATTTPSAFAAGDNALFDDSGIPQPLVKLGAGLSPGNLVVAAVNDYTFTTNVANGGITSLLSLTKRGPGKLIVDTDNSFSGPTSIEAGVLQIGNGLGRGTLGSSSISNGSALVVSRTGTLGMAGNLTGSGSFTNQLAGTVNLFGTNTMEGTIFLNAGTLILSNAPAAGNSKEVFINATVGTAGTRLLLAGGVAFPADATIKCLNTSSASNMRCNLLGNPGTNSLNGPILCSGDGLVQLNASGAGEFVVASAIAANPDDATLFNGQLFLRGSGAGKITGTVNLPNAFLNKVDAGNWTISSTGNSWSATALNVGLLRLGANDALPTGLSLQMGQSASSATFDLAGFNQQIGTLNLAPGLNNSVNIIANSSTTSDSVLTISGGGVYGGSIQDSISNGTRTVGITILGGAQQLTTTCTYSGPTTIIGGGLSLVGSGSIPNSASINIANGAAIDVSFKSDTTLTLNPGQTLKGDGDFNLVGNLVTQGTIELKLNKVGGSLTCDSVRSVTQMTYGGSLKLVITGDPLSSHDSVKLVHANNYTGAFSSILPASPGPGLVWNTNSLAIDGTLFVEASAVASNPTNITAAVNATGTELQLTWPGSHLGWTLQAQTNALNIGLNNNWFDVPASATTNQVVLPIDKAQGGVFYRLRN